MKRNVFSSVLAGLIMAATLAAPAFSQDAAPTALAGSGSVFVIPIQGDIEPSTAVFVQRRIKAALESGASDIIFTIDTFGGRVDSALRIAAAIGAIREARTVAFVGAGSDGMGVSWSAGALIALSCAEIYMAPGTSIGAAAPVVATPEGTMEGAGEKTVSAVRSQMAALAEKNGHPAGIALAMVDADVELVEVLLDGATLALTVDDALALERERGDEARRGRTLSAKGKLLSLTAGEAERYGLSEGTVGDLAALGEKLGGLNEVVELNPSFADSLVVFLSSAALQSILILIGLIALFIEINSPGFGLPGSIAIIAFVVLFGTNMLMGTVGSLEIILFILGMGLLVIEIFVLPGFGVAGISGLALIAGALVLSMQDFIVPENEFQWDILARNAATVGAGVLLGIIGIGVFIAAGPKLKLFDRLALKTAISATASGRPAPIAASSGALADTSGPAYTEEELMDTFSGLAIGDEGVAESVLRPVGRALIGGRSVSVEAAGRYVDAGTRLRVAAIKGGVVYVDTVQA
jgi:membrane-bound serine protease (ClpP class)